MKKVKNPRQKLGAWGEDQAAAYLRERGYTILDRNVRTPHGEIDVVALQDQEVKPSVQYDSSDNDPQVVFVEVKTRTSTSYGYPEEAVDARKQEHILASAEAYLQEHPELGDDWRVDVIAILKHRASPPEINHFENALT